MRIPEPLDLLMPPERYQPSKADQEEGIDMPGMSDEQIRETFFPSFRFVKQPR